MRACLFFSLLLVAASIQGQTNLTVTFIDQDLGLPLDGVKVSVSGQSTNFVTDEKGQIHLVLADSRPIQVTARLVGYRPLSEPWRPGQGDLTLKLALDEALEGEELVVIRPRPRQNDAEGGVSKVVGRPEIQTATMGLVEDVFSAVKTLPGIGYTGLWSAAPSIRGGDPNELVAALDGALVLSPYQWHGAFTIFNPDLTDSVKLSEGLTNVESPQVLSGLMEVTSKTPTDTDQHLDWGLSTTGVDGFLQQAFGSLGGLLVGGKLTWMDVPVGLAKLTGAAVPELTTVPYIRNGSTQLFWTPNERIRWTVNASVNTDGMTYRGGSLFDYNYHSFQGQLGTDFKLLLSDSLLVNALFNYNQLQTIDENVVKMGADGTPASFAITSNLTKERYQTKAVVDWNPTADQRLSWGVEELLESWSDFIHFHNSSNQFDYTIGARGKWTLSSGLFLNANLTLIPRVLKAEAGLRVDHSLVFADAIQLTTWPILNPRLRLIWTVVDNWPGLKAVNINCGSGLYSQFPADNPYLTGDQSRTDFVFHPSRLWLNELGLEVLGLDGEVLQLETYAKNYFDRAYRVSNFQLADQGTGWVVGADLGLKKSSLYWDGSLSYTFVYSQLFNPVGGSTSNLSPDFFNFFQMVPPLGVSYYPAWLRLHTLNAGLKFKPSDDFYLYVEGGLVTGSPTGSGQVGNQLSDLDHTQWGGFKYPLNIKFDWHGFYAQSRTRWEFYLGWNAILAPLYFQAPTSPAQIDLEFPVPSLGYKISY